ncbi:hypothetical protein R3P38DRAFT_3559424 [Favolaschia claudopus]|uniref:Reverse transcriptase zinc-binding domain-containing protein n=1 Tax=Favolaschia claudopus TaxID=2862362 RepID=A0AAW0AVQ4_9AGAR
MVVNSTHRKALTRLVLSQHPLAVERLRYKKRYHTQSVPRELRKCRFGCDAVEDAEHAMFFCEHSAMLLERRKNFSSKVSGHVPAVLRISSSTATAVLKALVFNRVTVCQVAKFVHQVFQIFDAEPIVWPNGF